MRLRCGTWSALVITLVMVLAVAATAVTVLGQQASATPEAKLGAAEHQAEVEGNLDKAIAIYKDVVADRRASRATVATALLHMADAYQKLGSAQARKIYEQIVKEYADQPAALAAARSGLAGLSGAGSQALSIRKIPSEGLDLDSASVSSDGRWISAVTSKGNLALRDLTTGTVRILPGQNVEPRNDTIYSPVLSPDGKRVAYTFVHDPDIPTPETSELRVLAVDGTGQPATVLRGDDQGSEIETIWPWAWSRDGQSILTEIERPDATWQLLWVSVKDGSHRTLKSLDWRRQRPRGRMRLSLSPDGRYIAYAALVNNPPSARESGADSSEKHVYILASDGSGETEITIVPGRAEMPVWTGDGAHLLMISGDALWAVPMAAGKPSGAAVVVKQGLTSGEPLGMTPSGAYYYRETPAGVRWLSIRDVDPSGAARPSAPGQTNFGLGGNRPLWSPTGALISYMRQASATEPATVVVRSSESGTEKAFRGLRPVAWFRDGRQLLVNVDARTAPNGTFLPVRQPFARLDVETGELTRLPVPPMHAVGILAPDDKTLYLAEGMTVKAFDLTTGQQRDVYRAAGPPGTGGMALSPDGRWLVVPVDKSVVLVGVDGNGARVIATLPKQVARMAWTGDGRAVLATTNTYPMDSPVFRIDVASGEVAPSGRSGPQGMIFQSSLSPDGSRVVLAVSEGAGARAELFAIDNVSIFLKTAK